MQPSFDALWDEDESIQEDWNLLDERVKSEIVSLFVNHMFFMVSEVSTGESPIEQLLGVWLTHLAEKTQFADDGCFVLNPQEEIETPGGRFRVDFLIAAKVRGQYVSIAVECDGHDFHEKTKAQAAKDKKRDRSLKLAGVDVIHFTGSEIWADPRECAKEVLWQLRAMADRLKAGV